MTSTPSRIRHSTTASAPLISLAGEGAGLAAGGVFFFMAGGIGGAVTKDDRFPEWQAWFSGTWRRLGRDPSTGGEPAAMGAKACAETHEPKIVVRGAGASFNVSSSANNTDGLLMLPWERSTRCWRRGECGAGRERVEHVAPARVTSTAAGGRRARPRRVFPPLRRAPGTERSRRLRSLPSRCSKRSRSRFSGRCRERKSWRAGRPPPASAPDRGGRAVAEQAGAHHHAMVVVEVEGGGADLDCDARDHGVGSRRQQWLAARSDGIAAPQPSPTILEDCVGAETELFRHVAGDSRTEIAGARADEERVDDRGAHAGLRERGSSARLARRGASARNAALSSSARESKTRSISGMAKWRAAMPLSRVRMVRRISCDRRESLQRRRGPRDLPALTLGEHAEGTAVARAWRYIGMVRAGG